MLRLGPEDGAVARALAAQVRRVSRLDMPAAMDKMPLGARLALLARLPSALPLLGWMKRPVSGIPSLLSAARNSRKASEVSSARRWETSLRRVFS